MSAGSVAVVVTEEMHVPSWDLYELSIPCTVFGKPQPDLAEPWYDLRLCGTGELGQDPGTPANGTTGLSLHTRYGLADLVSADTVIVPSVPDACVDGKPLPPELITALRHAYDSGARMVSCAREPSPSPRRASSTAAGPPPTGCTRPNWRPATRRWRSTTRCCTWTTATSSPAPD